jgi:hypothetical protein
MTWKFIARKPSQNFRPFPLRVFQCYHLDETVQPPVLHTAAVRMLSVLAIQILALFCNNGIKYFTFPTPDFAVEPFIYGYINTYTLILIYYLFKKGPNLRIYAHFSIAIRWVWILHSYCISTKNTTLLTYIYTSLLI